MTDPFSVAVGVITVTAACNSCLKELNSLVQGFRSAPEEILALSNEITDMSVVLTEVKVMCEDPVIISKLVMFSLKRTGGNSDNFKSNLRQQFREEA
jgi:hypothetical protein